MELVGRLIRGVEDTHLRVAKNKLLVGVNQVIHRFIKCFVTLVSSCVFLAFCLELVGYLRRSKELLN
jgi:hypothetical protein